LKLAAWRPCPLPAWRTSLTAAKRVPKCLALLLYGRSQAASRSGSCTLARALPVGFSTFPKLCTLICSSLTGARHAADFLPRLALDLAGAMKGLAAARRQLWETFTFKSNPRLLTFNVQNLFTQAMPSHAT